MGKVLAVCVSESKGTQKHEVGEATFLSGHGIEGDAHAGRWHRQVSLLSYGKIEEFRQRGAKVNFGAFGENLVVEGIDFRKCPVGTRFSCNGVLLELTQIGKECHAHCAIHQQVGDCIMPREGVFAVVLQGGRIHVGDKMEALPPKAGRPYRAAVITLSDKGAAGKREDTSGPAAAEHLLREGYEVVEQLMLPDERASLVEALVRLADMRQVDLILTTGGTGFAPRDITPEATMEVAQRNAPGIAEAIRADSMRHTPRAMLSRGVSVIRGRTLIVNLPGSTKAVHECMDCILDQLGHGIALLRGTGQDCART